VVTGNDNCLKRPKKRPNPIDVHIGGRLRLRRLELEISPAELARVLGLTPEQYEECENGARRLGAELLVRTARLLELPISWFYEGFAQQVASDIPPLQEPAPAVPAGTPEECREDTLLRYFRKLPTENQQEVVDVAGALVGATSQTSANENGES
jgi:transcriptional regulator with XRE-family HTH domain